LTLFGCTETEGGAVAVEPDLGQISSVSELVSQLKLMFEASQLSYDRFAAKSGLSTATVHAMVNKPGSLPRDTSLAAFVSACGRSPAPWLAVRAHLIRSRGRPVRVTVADVREELARAHQRIGELEHLLGEARLAESVGEPLPRVVPAAVKAVRYLTAQEVFRYPVDGVQNRNVCIITGHLSKVMNVDVWVNPENTLMRMSKRYHQTVSGTIRLYGAQRDAGGHIVKDLIADELSEKVAGRTPVHPGVAISTGSGLLKSSNNVRAIVHVAAVQIEEGMGRRQLQEIDLCVFNVLHEVDQLATTVDPPLRSVVFSLFGTGSGHGDRESTAQVMVDSAVTYLRHKQTTAIREVYFCARSSLTLDCLQGAVQSSYGLLPRAGQS
jgi:O-acetyl-ADP-ribose deacetylase (regulator of RNase III)